MKFCRHCGAEFVASDWTCPGCTHVPASEGGFTLLARPLDHGAGGYRPEAFATLAAAEAGSFWFRARNRLLVWTLRQHYPLMQRYLEIGCGTGYVLAGVHEAFPAAEIIGTEVFSAGLRYAANRVPTAELLVMDARDIPYREHVDVIGAYDVLEHIEQDEAVLAAMRLALKPGGGLLLTVPQHRWLWSAADDSARHVRRYSATELGDKVRRAGFKLEFETAFVSLLLPAMLLSRLTKRRPKAHEEVVPELGLPGWLNALFEWVMGIEFWLIRRGWHPRLGGSRLVLASKEK